MEAPKALRRLALVELVNRRSAPPAYDLQPRNREHRRCLARKLRLAAKENRRGRGAA
jgi:hypothetical protein